MPADLLITGEITTMPKTYGNLYSTICSFDNIFKAYKDTCKNKRYTHEKLEFENKLEDNLIEIQNLLTYKQWQSNRLREFWVYDPKKRLISAPSFRDRVVHHSLVRLIEPLFEKKFIFDSYACRKGKGTHAAVLRTMDFLRMARHNYGIFYVLKCDISKYFQSINHDNLKSIMRRTIRCKDTLWLIDKIIDAGGSSGVGVPIGALTSQLFANIYLNELDHFIKDKMRIKYYVRYMDDFIIIHSDKQYLWDLFDAIEEFVNYQLLLKLNDKSCLFKFTRGIDFCGYRMWPTHILPRKRNVKRARNKMKKLARLYSLGLSNLNYVKAVLMSFIGYMEYCCGYTTTKHILRDLVLRRGGNTQ